MILLLLLLLLLHDDPICNGRWPCSVILLNKQLEQKINNNKVIWLSEMSQWYANKERKREYFQTMKYYVSIKKDVWSEDNIFLFLVWIQNCLLAAKANIFLTDHVQTLILNNSSEKNNHFKIIIEKLNIKKEMLKSTYSKKIYSESHTWCP